MTNQKFMCLWTSQKRLKDEEKQGAGVLLYKHPDRERERTVVRCGVAVWRSALWDMLRCNGVAMVTRFRQSVLAVGVTECKSAYATSALIFTARATGKHLTRSRCLRATPAFQRQRGAGMQRRPFLRSGERFKGSQATGEEEGRI